MTRGKLLIISLDCVNAALLDQWSATGRLPTLAKLREGGASARMRSNSVSIEADWHTFYTGRQPSEHGHVSYDEIVPGTYRSGITTGPRTDAAAFWETASQEGASVIVLNPTHARPAPGVSGVVVTDWLVHDAGHYRDAASEPPELVNALKARYPTDPVSPYDWGNTKTAKPSRLLAAKRETLRRKAETLLELLSERSWDLCYAGFDECHEMSHLFWHLHDPAHPSYRDTPKGKDPLAATLLELDAAIGRIVEATGPECTVIVYSLGGIGPNYGWSHLVDTILNRLDGQNDRSSESYVMLRRLWNRLPHPVQIPLFAFRHSVREAMLARRRKSRRAFALPLNERGGGIRINLVGREPAGLVERGQDYDEVCQDLIEGFRELVCARTGVPLVREIVKTQDVLDGPFLERLPDLMIEWNVDQPIAVATSPRTGEIRRDFTDARTGHHMNDGFLLVSGAGERVGPFRNIVDLADPARAIVAHVSSGQTPFGAGILD